MGQHRLAGDVADGVDAAHRGLAALADADEAAVHVEHQLVEAEPGRRRRAADSHKNLVRRQLALLAVGRLDAQPVALGGLAERLGAEQDLDAQRREALGDGRGQLGIVERQDLLLRLDHGDLAAELGEGSAELEPDIAAADHDEALRQFSQRQRAGRGDDVAAEGQEGQFDRHRAGRDHDGLGLDDLGTGLGLDRGGLAVAEAGLAMDDLDLGLAQQAGDAIVEALDDTVLPGDGLLQVELGLGGGQAEGRLAGGGMGRLLELLGDMDHRLGGDAADVEAGAAQLAALDDDGVDAELAGADGADIAARAGADDEELAGDVGHVSLPPLTCPRTASPASPAAPSAAERRPPRPSRR